MKKIIAVLLSIILASSCIVPVLAEEIKVPIDFSIMSIEELLSLDSAIHSEIESRSTNISYSYSFDVQTDMYYSCL